MADHLSGLLRPQLQQQLDAAAAAAAATAVSPPAAAAASSSPGLLQRVQHDVARDVWQVIGHAAGQPVVLSEHASQFDALAAAAAHPQDTQQQAAAMQQLQQQQQQLQQQQQQQQQQLQQQQAAVAQSMLARMPSQTIVVPPAPQMVGASQLVTPAPLAPPSGPSPAAAAAAAAATASAVADADFADQAALHAQLQHTAEIAAVAAEAQHRQEQVMALMTQPQQRTLGFRSHSSVDLRQLQQQAQQQQQQQQQQSSRLLQPAAPQLQQQSSLPATLSQQLHAQAAHSLLQRQASVPGQQPDAAGGLSQHLQLGQPPAQALLTVQSQQLHQQQQQQQAPQQQLHAPGGLPALVTPPGSAGATPEMVSAAVAAAAAVLAGAAPGGGGSLPAAPAGSAMHRCASVPAMGTSSLAAAAAAASSGLPSTLLSAGMVAAPPALPLALAAPAAAPGGAQQALQQQLSVPQQQQQQQHAAPYKGVVWDPAHGQWQAQALGACGNVVLLGLAARAEDAAAMYDRRLVESGTREQAKLNFPLSCYVAPPADPAGAPGSSTGSGAAATAPAAAAAAALPPPSSAGGAGGAFELQAQAIGVPVVSLLPSPPLGASAADAIGARPLLPPSPPVDTSPGVPPAAGNEGSQLQQQQQLQQQESLEEPLETSRRPAPKPRSRRSKGKNPASQYKGVSWSASTNRWAAVMWDSALKKARHLGVFHSEEEAARTYDRAVLMTHGRNNNGINFDDSMEMFAADIKPDEPDADAAAAAAAAASLSGPDAAARRTSRYTGVTWQERKRRWEARASCDGHIVFGGSFVAEEDAARAFDRLVLRHLGPTGKAASRLNFPLASYSPEEYSQPLPLKGHRQQGGGGSGRLGSDQQQRSAAAQLGAFPAPALPPLPAVAIGSKRLRLSDAIGGLFDASPATAAAVSAAVAAALAGPLAAFLPPPAASPAQQQQQQPEEEEPQWQQEEAERGEALDLPATDMTPFADQDVWMDAHSELCQHQEQQLLLPQQQEQQQEEEEHQQLRDQLPDDAGGE